MSSDQPHPQAFPLQPGRTGRCVHAEGPGYKAGGQGCRNPVAWAGLTYFSHPRTMWRSFACEEHKSVLIRPEPFGRRPEHAAEIARREAAIRRMELGELWEPPQPIRRGTPPPT